MTRGNILTEEEIARLAALPEKQRDYAVKIYAAREKKKSTAYTLSLHDALPISKKSSEHASKKPKPSIHNPKQRKYPL